MWQFKIFWVQNIRELLWRKLVFGKQLFERAPNTEFLELYFWGTLGVALKSLTPLLLNFQQYRPSPTRLTWACPSSRRTQRTGPAEPIQSGRRVGPLDTRQHAWIPRKITVRSPHPCHCAVGPCRRVWIRFLRHVTFLPFLFLPPTRSRRACRRRQPPLPPGPAWQRARRLQVKAYPPATPSSPDPHVSLTRRHAFALPPPESFPAFSLAASRCRLRLLLGYIAASRGEGDRPNQQPSSSLCPQEHRRRRIGYFCCFWARRSSRRRSVCPQLFSHLVVSLVSIYIIPARNSVRFFLVRLHKFRDTCGVCRSMNFACYHHHHRA